MKILILTRYDYDGPSSRFRYFQYQDILKNYNLSYEIKPLLSNNYIKFLFNGKKFPLIEIIKGYLKRIFILIKKNKYDIIWLEQEAFPWIPFYIEKLFLFGKPKIVADYDDAFFHRYDLHKNFFVRKLLGRKIDSVMKNSSVIFAGNDYLAERAKKSGAKNIVIFPTVVDTNVYKRKNVTKENKFIIGWLGSPSTEIYLNEIKNVFYKLSSFNDIKFVFVGAKNISFDFDYEIINWKEETEIEEISKFDVGIMPLKDGPFERGKCGFKLIQYLSCEIPVVGSPVGVNDKIIQHGINGFKANNEDEWYNYLLKLKNDKELRIKMGIEGRKFIIENYSLEKNSNILKTVFDSLK